jgi:hypothetical protein
LVLRLGKFKTVREVTESGEIILKFSRILARIEFTDLRINGRPVIVRAEVESSCGEF